MYLSNEAKRLQAGQALIDVLGYIEAHGNRIPTKQLAKITGKTISLKANKQLVGTKIRLGINEFLSSIGLQKLILASDEIECFGRERNEFLKFFPEGNLKLIPEALDKAGYAVVEESLV